MTTKKELAEMDNERLLVHFIETAMWMSFRSKVYKCDLADFDKASAELQKRKILTSESIEKLRNQAIGRL